MFADLFEVLVAQFDEREVFRVPTDGRIEHEGVEGGHETSVIGGFGGSEGGNDEESGFGYFEGAAMGVACSGAEDDVVFLIDGNAACEKDMVGHDRASGEQVRAEASFDAQACVVAFACIAHGGESDGSPQAASDGVSAQGSGESAVEFGGPGFGEVVAPSEDTGHHDLCGGLEVQASFIDFAREKVGGFPRKPIGVASGGVVWACAEGDLVAIGLRSRDEQRDDGAGGGVLGHAPLSGKLVGVELG